MKKIIIIIISILISFFIILASLPLIGLNLMETFFPSSVVRTGTSGSYAEKTEKLLEKKYGEKFKVIRYGNNQATVYPEANPDLLFTARRFSKSNVVDDDYIQEIIGLQYKKLAEDVLKDFKYDYYLDVDLEFTYEPIDAKQDVTIEEFKKVFPKEVKPEYYLYVSDEALEMSDKELYDWVNSVALISEHDNCKVAMYFVDDYYKELVLDNYKNYSYIEDYFFKRINDNMIHVSQFMENDELTISFERFKEIKEGIK